MINDKNTHTYTNNFAELVRLATARGVIIVHPNENIIAKAMQKLQKTK